MRCPASPHWGQCGELQLINFRYRFADTIPKDYVPYRASCQPVVLHGAHVGYFVKMGTVSQILHPRPFRKGWAGPIAIASVSISLPSDYTRREVTATSQCYPAVIASVSTRAHGARVSASLQDTAHEWRHARGLRDIGVRRTTASVILALSASPTTLGRTVRPATIGAGRSQCTRTQSRHPRCCNGSSMQESASSSSTRPSAQPRIRSRAGILSSPPPASHCAQNPGRGSASTESHGRDRGATPIDYVRRASLARSRRIRQ
jgi:hypothetical protein